MKILIVSQYFYPETFRVNDIAIHLIERGHEVTVLTGLPNYPQGTFFKGYKFKFYKENYQGVEVLRCPLIPRGNSKLQLILNYLSFPISASFISLSLIERKFDRVFICQLSPIFLAIPGLVYNFFAKSKVIMWVLDLWPESLSATNTIKNPIILWLMGFISRIIYSCVDLILVSSEGFSKSINRWDISYTPVKFFPQWGEDLFENLNEVEPISLPKESSYKLKILFAGNLGSAQGLDVLLRAMGNIRDIPVGAYIVGDGRDRPRLKKIKKELSLENVHFLPKVPLTEVPSYFKASDVLFLSLVNDPMLGLTIPGKLQAYLASGKPVLCSASGEAASIVSSSGCGLTSKASDSASLEKNIRRLYDEDPSTLEKMGAAGFRYYKKNFQKEALLDSFDKLIN